MYNFRELVLILQPKPIYIFYMMGKTGIKDNYDRQTRGHKRSL